MTMVMEEPSLSSLVIREKLEARYYLYTLLQMLLGEQPSQERFEAIETDAIYAASEALGLRAPEALAHQIAHSTLDMKDARREYTTLFLGPAVLPVPMWESTYATGENVIFTKETLAVRSFYRECGLLPTLYPRVADDHIAFEIGFLALLAKQALDAQNEDDLQGSRTALTKSKRFIDEHLGCWVAEWSREMHEKSESSLYTEAASLAAELVECDRRLLQELGGLV